MTLKHIGNTTFNFIKNIPGWKNQRKIVVIESDDWGSIRMSSRTAYTRLLNAGLNLNGGDGLRYSLYDSIESASDLEPLYDILYSNRDYKNTPAVITANCVVANPDFNKIRESSFQEYFYEPVTETLKKHKGCDTTFKLWKDGIYNNIFIPQFHGREHLNIPVWMNALKSGDYETILAFNEGIWSFIPKYYSETKIEYEAAFQLSEFSDIKDHEKIIKVGLDLFEKLFGYRATYFVPPNGCINNKLNSTCFINGIKYRSTSKIQRESIKNNKNRKRIHWLGEKDTSGIRYIIRNCVFEPSKPGKDWVDRCLTNIKIAFDYCKPAIITTHRVNFIGVHDVSNRDKGLRELNKLLKTILSTWPDVEFMTSSQLGDLMETNY